MDVLMPASSNVRGFVCCDWICAECAKHGTVRVWPYRGDTREVTAERHQRETRAGCLKACRYRVTPHPDAVARSDGDGQSGPRARKVL